MVVSLKIDQYAEHILVAHLNTRQMVRFSGMSSLLRLGILE